MYGVSKISSEQNIMLTTFPGAQYSPPTPTLWQPLLLRL